MIKEIRSYGTYVLVAVWDLNSNALVDSDKVTWSGNERALHGHSSYGSTFPLGQQASVALSPDAEEAITWAIKKMEEEAELNELCKEFSEFQDIYDKYRILHALSKQEKK